MNLLLTQFMLLLTAVAPEADPQLFFAPLRFLENLKYMGIGMVVIFAIIGIIILATYLINYLFSK